jgi:hypothetical protein
MKENNYEQKKQVLEHMEELMNCFTDKLKILEALDDDRACSGCADLNDQLDSLWKHQTKLKFAISRAKEVVPNDLAKLYS